MFKVTDEEFALARLFFEENPHSKFKRTEYGTSYSFIQLHVDSPLIDPIFAIANEDESIPLLGRGGNAKVKRVRNAAGQEFALKIEGGDASLSLRNDADPSLIIMRHFNFFKGQALRRYSAPKRFLHKTILSKRYTLLELIEGENLLSILKRDREAPFLTELQKKIIALCLCLNVRSLHENNFVHGDIKHSNFIVTSLKGNNIAVRIVDLDYALILSPEGFATWPSNRGTEDFIAPETRQWNRYSKFSDIYGLGIIFFLLGLNALAAKMTHNVPHNRRSLSEIILLLVDAIRADKAFDTDTNTFVDNLLNPPQPLIDDTTNSVQERSSRKALTVSTSSLTSSGGSSAITLNLHIAARTANAADTKPPQSDTSPHPLSTPSSSASPHSATSELAGEMAGLDLSTQSPTSAAAAAASVATVAPSTQTYTPHSSRFLRPIKRFLGLNKESKIIPESNIVKTKGLQQNLISLIHF